MHSRIATAHGAKNNYFRIGDLETSATGKLHGYIGESGIEWKLEVIGEPIPMPVCDFGFYLTSGDFKELDNSDFSLTNSEFTYEFKGSESFYFTPSGDLVPVHSLDVRIERTRGMSNREMRFQAKGNISPMYGDQYMHNVPSELSVDATFEEFQCSDSESIDQDIAKIRQLSGVLAVHYLRDGLHGDRFYTVS